MPKEKNNARGCWDSIPPPSRIVSFSFLGEYTQDLKLDCFAVRCVRLHPGLGFGGDFVSAAKGRDRVGWIDQRPGHLTIPFLAYCWGLEGLACYKLQIRKVGMPFCPSSLTISNLIGFLGILSRACMLGNNSSTLVLLTAYCRCFHSLIPLKGCAQN